MLIVAMKVSCISNISDLKNVKYVNSGSTKQKEDKKMLLEVIFTVSQPVEDYSTDKYFTILPQKKECFYG